MGHYTGYAQDIRNAVRQLQQGEMMISPDEMDGDEHTGRQSRLGMDFMAIPAEALASLARVLYEGGKTHQDPDGSNWRKIPVEGHLNHALYHINAYQRGVVGEDHLAHAMCRLVMAYTVENGG